MLDIADKLLFGTFFIKIYAVYFSIAHFILTLY